MTATTGRSSFRPRARIVHLLGDQLISNEVMAVVELVKNAYDADARNVVVRIDQNGGGPEDCIEVLDDGDGMDLDTLLNVWLEVATDNKRKKRRRRERTRLGRYLLGEKGIGRFAAGKLGSSLELLTRAHGSDSEIRLLVPWESFGGNGYLDEIENHWEVTSPRFFSGRRRGTLIRASGLRARWDERRVQRLREGLLRLVSPSSHERDFTIELQCEEFPDLSGPVVQTLVDRAPYGLVGSVDSVGLLRIDEPEDEAIDLAALAPERFGSGRERRKPRCGPFRISLSVWDLDSVGWRRAGVTREMREVLRRSHGVSLYRDGFRVWPYGEAGNDWLELNQRRVNNPTMRVSTNQIIGFVEIASESSPDLIDRTSREGLIDSPALEDLKALVIGALSRLEQGRFALRQQRLMEQGSQQTEDPLLDAVSRLRANGHGTKAAKGALRRIEDLHRHNLKVGGIREERLMRLAGVGLASEQISAELARAVGRMSGLLQAARGINGSGSADDLRAVCRRIEGHIALLSEQLDALEGISGEGNADPDQPVDVRSVVNDAATIFAFRLEEAKIRLVIEGGGVSTSISRARLLQILLHLFDNAIDSLTRDAGVSAPEVRVRIEHDPHGLVIADNGPGVKPEARDLVFRPFFSGHSNGRGLGLYLVKTLAESSGASVQLVDRPEVLRGANIRLGLPGTPSTA